MRIRKRLAQLGLIMVALPLVGWGLEQLAKRAEERRPGSGKWLRTGFDSPTASAGGPSPRVCAPPRR